MARILALVLEVKHKNRKKRRERERGDVSCEAEGKIPERELRAGLSGGQILALG